MKAEPYDTRIFNEAHGRVSAEPDGTHVVPEALVRRVSSYLSSVTIKATQNPPCLEKTATNRNGNVEVETCTLTDRQLAATKNGQETSGMSPRSVLLSIVAMSRL